jgi:23S rRNA (guanine745-N1)-methyltransferase
VADGWIACLACPHCGSGLDRTGGVLRCAEGHTFDVARQGYVNLLTGAVRKATADTAAMLSAREEFLGAGHYRPLIDRVATVAGSAAEGVEGCVVEVGSGPGVYLAASLDLLPGRAGLALDLSKHAARRAARSHPRAGAVVCDAWERMPVQDSVAALVLSVFAPRNVPEFVRMLAPNGAVVVAAPTGRHLENLVDGLGMIGVDPDKGERIRRGFSGAFRLEQVEILEQAIHLSRAEAVAAAAMGPTAFHVPADELRRRAMALDEPVETVLSVEISTWRLTH